MERDEYYEVAFIRRAFTKNGRLYYRIHWAGWGTKDETNEPATSVASYGESFNRFWLNISPEEIYGTKSSVSLKKAIVTKLLHAESSKASQLPNPGPLPDLPLGISSLDTNEESSASTLPYPDTIVVDPQVLWLPPDRIGQAVDDPEELFKIVVNALEREGINGYKFYQHLKKDRKDFGQKWFKEQECVICTSGSIQTVLTCPTRAVGYCGPCSIQLLLASRKEFSTGQLQCPCCRQPGYLIATEWIFVQDEEARDRHKAEYQKQRRQQRKIRIKEQKSVQQYEEGEIQE